MSRLKKSHEQKLTDFKEDLEEKRMNRYRKQHEMNKEIGSIDAAN